MKKLWVAVFLAAFFVPFLASANTNVKLAVVDVQEVIDKIEEGKQVKMNLEQEKNKKEGELEGKKKELAKMRQDFERQRLILSQDALMEKQMQMEKKMRDMQTIFLASSEELQKKYNETLVSIYRRIESVVTKIAKENNYTMVLEKGDGRGVMYTKPAYDITAKVITTYNKVYPSKNRKGKK